MAKVRKFPEFIFPLVLTLVALWLCFRNFTPGTYLVGWDSLHPEFNFPEAFRRVWEGVWRGEQGLGVIAAHSHMADTPRLILIWLESFVVPASFLRYSYIFLCLTIGPLGVYYFLRYVFQKEKESHWIYPAAFLGALFYLLNLGTLQNFYVPFDMFPAAFAGLPWLIFSGLKYLREGKKSNLIFWAIIVILSSPMAYAATLWYTSFAGLFIFFGTFALISSARKLKLKRFAVLISTAILLNLYWILPSIYSIINQSGAISNANINRLFSQEAFLRNADYGDFKDLLLQKNFLFGWRNFDFANGQFKDLLGVWILYLSNPLVSGVGYGLAGISIFGLVFSVINREKVALALIPVTLFCLFFLLNINPPFGGLYSYLYNHSGTFAEGLRMPFTKFSIFYELILSFYFGYFLFVIFTIRTRLLAFLKMMLIVVVTASTVYFMLPAFYGEYIGQNVRVSLPSEYSNLFKFLNSNPSGRIVLMPINSKYGWEYRSWGYEGSGFLTFGTSDPILYRDFDRWGSANEDFYSQASFALYSNDNQTFVDTLEKYQVRYLLLDESIINPGGSSDTLRIPQIKNIADSFGMRKVFNSGFLTVYDTGFGQEEGTISAPTKVSQIDGNFSYSPVDPVYKKNRDYIDSDVTPVRKVPSLPVEAPLISENLSINRGFGEAFNCDLENLGRVFKSDSSKGILYRAEGGGASCDYLSYPDLAYSEGYVLRIAGENTAGRSLKIYLFNNNSKVPEIEEILPNGHFDENFLIYPKDMKGSGYTLNLETRSFGRLPSENLLTKVEFYPVDSDYLQTFEGGSQQGDARQNNLKIVRIKKYGIWAYKVDVENKGLIQLGQGYDKGWIGFTVENSKLKILDHKMINSWANGWVVPADSPSPLTIYLVYWPQLLEWGGGVLGIITLLVLVLKRHKRYPIT